MSAKKWSFSYKKTGKQEWKQNILDTISLWTAIGLLWYSFFSIIGEHFPEYLSTDSWIIYLFAFLLWIGYEWPKKYLKKMTFACHLATILIPVVYILVHLEKVLDGIVRLAWFYMPYFNEYYNSNYFLGIASENENAVYAFTAICMLFWWLSWTIAYGWKKRVLLVLFPFWALVFELVVGLSPIGNGLFFAFFGAMLLITMEGASVMKRVVAVACVGISILLSGALFQEEMDTVTLKRQKQALLKWQNSMNLENINLANLFQFDFHFNWEKLNNGTPQYTGKTMLEIETDIQPVTTLYLKGFYGTNYENGDWEFDDSYFKEACRKAGRSPEAVAKQIFQMPYERIEVAYGELLSETSMDYQIYYVGAAGNVAYTTYLSDYDALDDSYTFVGDYLLKKPIFDTYTSGKGNKLGYQYVGNWGDINNAIEDGRGSVSNQKEELDFLNSLSDAYLQLPEERAYLAEAIGKIENEIRMFGDDIENENYRRILCASEVAKYLESQMCYSLKLDTLPDGMDPIEYALTVSREGYCMHFASAATLMLRELGVPARYVSGYAVEASTFVKDAETGIYKAEVGDFMAHAWVEIYLDNIGWTILEATPGSSLGNLPTQEEIDRWEEISELGRDGYEEPEMPSESENPENSEAPTEETEETEDTPTESEDPQNTQQDTQTESEEDENQPNGVGNDNGENSMWQLLRVFGIVGGVVAIFAAIVFTAKYGIHRYRSVLQNELEKKMTKKAVKRINRRMYRTLRLRNPKLWFAKKMSDKEYENALIVQYPALSEAEWRQFMDIVKKNHFSKEKITVEEMQFCYDCYKKKEKK